MGHNERLVWSEVAFQPTIYFLQPRVPRKVLQDIRWGLLAVMLDTGYRFVRFTTVVELDARVVDSPKEMRIPILRAKPLKL